MRVCLTGGIACGKSLAAKYFADCGWAVLDADDVVHQLEAPGGAAVQPIVTEFGTAVLDASGGIDRTCLAQMVFSNPAKRARLAELINPLIRVRLQEFVNQSESAPRLVVIPLLFEVKWQADYDLVLCVASARQTQIERMLTTRNYTREQAEVRLAAQMPIEQKMALADYVIDNNADAVALRLAVQQAVQWVQKQQVKN